VLASTTGTRKASRTTPRSKQARINEPGLLNKRLELGYASFQIKQHSFCKFRVDRFASSTELVGKIVLGEACEFVVEYCFVDLIGAESVGFSEGHFGFRVHALNAAAG